MTIPLEEILGLIPELEAVRKEFKENIRAGIEQTLSALSLRPGTEYLSLGIGRNVLPVIIAMQGVNVSGFDINEESLQYQQGLSEKFGSRIHEAGGSFKVFNYNFDDPPATRFIKGFESPNVNRQVYDYVECLNSSNREGAIDVAQIVLGFAKPGSSLFVSSYGGPEGEDDLLVRAVMTQTYLTGLSASIVETGLFVSNCYNREDYSRRNGVVLESIKLVFS